MYSAASGAPVPVKHSAVNASSSLKKTLYNHPTYAYISIFSNYSSVRISYLHANRKFVKCELNLCIMVTSYDYHMLNL
jgi:hypothetical protein